MDILFSKQAADETFTNSSKSRSYSSSEDDGEAPPPISSRLLLKPSSKAQAHSAAASRALERDVVLRRIRDHRSLSRVRNALQALRSGGRHDNKTWVDPDDAFSSP